MARFKIEEGAQLIRAAREDAGLTQSELATRAGITQPNLSQMESGQRQPSAEMLERILRAADYRPSVPLQLRAASLLALARRYGLTDVRVFGSVARGEDGFASDVDLFVNPSASTSLFTLNAFRDDAEQLLGFPVDVIADGRPGIDGFDRARAEAVPL